MKEEYKFQGQTSIFFDDLKLYLAFVRAYTDFPGAGRVAECLSCKRLY